MKQFWSVAFATVAVLMSGCVTQPAGCPMKLVILGEKGTMYTAKYTVDGLKQEATGLMPDTIQFGGRNAEWEVQRPSGGRDFRVELYVGEVKHSSTTSSGKSKIRGAVRYDKNQEVYWGEAKD